MLCENICVYALICYMNSYRRNIALIKSVAHKLAEIRKSKGLSQTDVYIDTDLNIGHIEAGRKNVTLSTLAILCKYYDITLEEFFRGIDVDADSEE